jgi:hypothetical protein
VRGLIPLFGIDSLGDEPCVFVFRKRAAPSVGEIEDRHVKDEQGVVPGFARSKKVAYSVSEIVFTLSGFHADLYFSNANTLAACHHVAVAGFWGAPFEGGRKSGGECRRLLE